MVLDQSFRRMTLRQLLTHSEKCARDLIEHFHATVMPSVADFRDLSRPVRRRSHYPAMLALMNALNKLQQVGDDPGADAAVTARQQHTHARTLVEEEASRRSHCG